MHYEPPHLKEESLKSEIFFEALGQKAYKIQSITLETDLKFPLTKCPVCKAAAFFFFFFFLLQKL